jgi:hypothetical protein
MTIHMWGDDWPYWPDLENARIFIYKYVKRYSGCRLMSKEKYGTIRYEYVFPPGGGLFYRTWWQKYWLGSNLYNMWVNFGWKMTARAIRKAVLKWPQLTKELVCDFDRDGFLAPELERIRDFMWGDFHD